MNKRLLIVTQILLFLTFISCQPPTPHDESNSVRATAPDAQENVEQGYTLPGLNHGIMQSPINIITKYVEIEGKHKVVMGYKTSSEKVANLGHTVQVNYDEGNFITFESRTFDFKQFHFHTPSEHLIDGVTYPLEIHMVHTLQGQEKDETTVYCVVGILFKEGKTNPFLEEFINAIPLKVNEVNEVKGGTVNINDLLNQEETLDYYYYQGSLTTPPFTETVTWLVMKNVLEASQEQIQKLNAIVCAKRV